MQIWISISSFFPFYSLSPFYSVFVDRLQEFRSLVQESEFKNMPSGMDPDFVSPPRRLYTEKYKLYRTNVKVYITPISDG